MQMKTIFAMIYTSLMCFIAIGTVIGIEQDFWISLFFASIWSAIMTGGVYFAITVKNKWLSLFSTGITAWFFSMFTFEVIGIFNPSLVANVDKPSQTYVWHLMAFMAFVVIISIRYGKRASTRSN